MEDKTNNTQIYPKLEREHCIGPIPNILISFSVQYKKVYFKDFILKIYSHSKADCYCLIKSNVVQIHNFIKLKHGGAMIVEKMFTKYGSLYNYPFPSQELDIFVVEQLSDLKMWQLINIDAKCLIFPYKEKYISFPLLHTNHY